MSLKENKFYPQWPVRINNKGILEYPTNRQAWENYKIPYYDKHMVLILKPPTKERSRQEEKFYWAVVVAMVAESMQIGRDEAHKMLAEMFLRVEEVSPTGVRYRRILSTTELGDKAYREYWEKCIHWAALPTRDDGLSPLSGLELVIPFPNEVDYTQAI